MESDRPKHSHARRHKKVCPVCGVEYMGRKNQVYCSYDCYKKAVRSRDRKKPYTYDSQKAAKQNKAFRDMVGKQAKIAVAALSSTERLELSYAFLSVYEGQKLYFCGAHTDWKIRCKRVRDEDGRLLQSCAVCGKTFVASTGGRSTEYCSAECKHVARNLQSRKISPVALHNAETALLHIGTVQRKRLAAMLAEVV